MCWFGCFSKDPCTTSTTKRPEVLVRAKGLCELWRWFQIEDQEVSTTCCVKTLVGWHVMMYIITSDFYIGIYYSRCCVLVFEVVTFTTTLLHGCMIGSLGSCTQIFHIFEPWKSCLQGASVDMSCREKKQSTSLMERYWYYMFLGCKITLYHTQRAFYTIIWHHCIHFTL